jgi:hypothetical protein
VGKLKALEMCNGLHFRHYSAAKIPSFSLRMMNLGSLYFGVVIALLSLAVSNWGAR